MSDYVEMTPAYVRLREGEWARTVELEPGTVFADYDAQGRLLGIEFLAYLGIRAGGEQMVRVEEGGKG